MENEEEAAKWLVKRRMELAMHNRVGDGSILEGEHRVQYLQYLVEENPAGIIQALKAVRSLLGLG